MKFDGHLVCSSSATAPRRLEPPKENLHAGLGARMDHRLSPGARCRPRAPAAGVSVGEALRLYSADHAVAVVEPNYLRRPAEYTPNDQRFGDQWGLRNTGQPHHVTYLVTEASGTPGADISVSEAWEIQRGVLRPSSPCSTTAWTSNIPISPPTSGPTRPRSAEGALSDSRRTRSFAAGGGRCRYLVVTLEVATPPLVLRTVMCSGFTAH
jgi:hypothetical protein